jgi:hypothetical protein
VGVSSRLLRPRRYRLLPVAGDTYEGIIQEREDVGLVAALALLGYPVPDTLVEEQGRVGYPLGGLSQDASREEWVLGPAYDEGRRGDPAQPPRGVVAEVGLERR